MCAGSWLTPLNATRALVRLYPLGPALSYLQGMVTNDMRPLADSQATPVYAHMLTPKGKFLHDCIFYPEPGEGGGLLMEVDEAGLDHALDWLARYRLRRAVSLEDARAAWTPWAWHGAAAPDSKPPTGWWRDPRLPGLGLRAVVPPSSSPPTPTASLDSSSSNSSADCTTSNSWCAADSSRHSSSDAEGSSSSAGGSSSSGSSEGGRGGSTDHWPGSGPGSSGSIGSGPKLDLDACLYRSWRYRLGVAEGQMEIPFGQASPLEYNTDVLCGVSYTKGCYIGQERNSFTHFRGVIRRRCMPFKVMEPPATGSSPSPASVSVEQEVVRAGSQEVVGTVRGYQAGWGLMHVKLGPALAAAGGQERLHLKGAEHTQVQPIRPDWWPKEWGSEDGL